jgi:hypothetical protein
MPSHDSLLPVGRNVFGPRTIGLACVALAVHSRTATSSPKYARRVAKCRSGNAARVIFEDRILRVKREDGVHVVAVPRLAVAADRDL